MTGCILRITVLLVSYDTPNLSLYRAEGGSRTFWVNSVLFFVNLANILMLQVRNTSRDSPHARKLNVSYPSPGLVCSSASLCRRDWEFTHPKTFVDNVQIFSDAIYKYVRCAAISRFTVTNQYRGLSLSSTLVSRMMLRLRSDGIRHYRDSRVTEQSTVLTLSDLSGELFSVPPAVSVHCGGCGNEENLELKRDLGLGPGLSKP